MNERTSSRRQDALFAAALSLIRAGGDYSIFGPKLKVANVEFEMDDSQRTSAWAAIKEGEDG